MRVAIAIVLTDEEQTTLPRWSRGRTTPPELDRHLIVDNDAPHKPPKVKVWLARHKRLPMPFTPTRSSWLNVIERWFRNLTCDRLRNGVFQSVAQWEQAIRDYIDHHNADPTSVVWTRKAKDILKKVTHARASLNKVPTG